MSIRNSILPTTAAVTFLLLASASAAFGQESEDQQKCLNKLNKDGAAVAKAQGKEDRGCLMKAGAGTLVGTAQNCLAADAKGRVQKKKDKTSADELADCGTPPDFGYTSGATLNASAVQGKLDLTADVFGAPLDSAVIHCDTSKPGCKCQQGILNDVEKLASAKFAELLKCKKQVLLAGAASSAALVACVNDAGTPGSIAADTKGKIQTKLDKLNADIVAKCDTPGVSGAFPGSCNSMSGGALGACLDVRVECRVCQIINEMDGIFVNCDLFDDGVANASCLSGSGPTPTPTETRTSTPTPSVTPTPTITNTPSMGFQGALVATTGLFNYNATLGIPGSDAACSSNFGGSHTCTYAELQTADAANQLVGAVDTSSNPVTSFWAIDSGQPFDRQCNTNVPWDYQTAHTGRGGDSVALTSGHLGTFTPGKTGMTITGFCSNTHWVGCCH